MERLDVDQASEKYVYWAAQEAYGCPGHTGNHAMPPCPSTDGKVYQIYRSRHPCGTSQYTYNVCATSLDDLSFTHYVSTGPAPLWMDPCNPLLTNNNRLVILSDCHKKLYQLNLNDMTWSVHLIGYPSGGCPGSPAAEQFPLLTMDGTIAYCSGKLFLFGSSGWPSFWTLDLQQLGQKPVWEENELNASSKFPAPREGSIYLAHLDKIYLFGGKTETVVLNDIWVFDVYLNEWNRLASSEPPPTARWRHGTVVADGVLYVFGGRCENNREMCDLFAYNIYESRWYDLRKLGSSPLGRTDPVLAYYKQKIRIFGGTSRFQHLQDLQKHFTDTRHVLYTRRASVPVVGAPPSLPGGPVMSHRRQLSTLSDFLAVTTILKPTGELCYVDIATNTLHTFHLLSLTTTTQLTARPSTPLIGELTYLPTMVGDTRLVYLSKDHRALWVLDLCSLGWSVCPIVGVEHPPTYIEASLTGCGNKLVLFGDPSHDNLASLLEVWILDLWPSTASPSLETPVWEKHIPAAGERTPLSRVGHTCSVIGDKIYLFGGQKASQIFGDTWGFDVSIHGWSEISCTGAFPSPRSNHSALCIDGFMYIHGGISNNSRISGLSALKVSESCWHNLLVTPLLPPEGIKTVMISFGSKVYISTGSDDDRARTLHVLEIGRVLNAENHHPLHIPTLLRGDGHMVVIGHHNKAVAYGGYSDVFLAWHPPTGMMLVAKRPRFRDEELPTIDDVRKRFYCEADFAASVKHRHILPVCGAVEIGEDPHLVSPWMGLGNLPRYLEDRMSYLLQMDQLDLDHPIHRIYSSFNEARTIREIAAAIDHLHSLGFTHGDIKAANILLGDHGHALLCDFGLTKRTGSVTSEGQKGVGSFYFKSPELHENGTKTAKSDTYAFAMTIVEILTGRPPFPDLTAMAFYKQVVDGGKRPQFLPQSRAGLDFIPLWGVASRCWGADPGQRPSMKVVIKDLDEAYRYTPEMYGGCQICREHYE